MFWSSAQAIADLRKNPGCRRRVREVRATQLDRLTFAI
jgi:hypothetical protein